jgi:hypothetical protein
MVVREDACPLRVKPFYGKKRFVLCDAREIRIHCVCVQLGEAELATITATGESVYKCNACAKSLGSGSIDKTPAKSLESLSHHEGATSCLISVSTQLEAVLHTIQMVEFLIWSLI